MADFLHRKTALTYSIVEYDPPIAVTFNSRVTDDIIRLGINYKFDPNAAAPSYQAATVSRSSLRLDKARMISRSETMPST